MLFLLPTGRILGHHALEKICFAADRKRLEEMSKQDGVVHRSIRSGLPPCFQ